MDHLRSQIENYLNTAKVLQLATSNNDVPWVCSVYYVTDKNLNIYWLSYPSRRHSQNILANRNTAVSITVKEDLPVVGLQAEGLASEVNNMATIAKIMPKYIKKYGAGKDFMANAAKGINKHKMYCFKPKTYTLFDENNYGNNNPQILNIS